MKAEVKAVDHGRSDNERDRGRWPPPIPHLLEGKIPPNVGALAAYAMIVEVTVVAGTAAPGTLDINAVDAGFGDLETGNVVSSA